MPRQSKTPYQVNAMSVNIQIDRSLRSTYLSMSRIPHPCGLEIMNAQILVMLCVGRHVVPPKSETHVLPVVEVAGFRHRGDRDAETFHLGDDRFASRVALPRIGMDVSRWRFYSVPADGSYIVGKGTHYTNGVPGGEAFIVIIPSPRVPTLFLFGPAASRKRRTSSI